MTARPHVMASAADGTAQSVDRPPVESPSGDSQSVDPNAVCAPCHQQIYDRYRTTPMARASGVAEAGFIPGDLRHAPSGIHYRVFEQGDAVWLSYERESAPAGHELSGRQRLLYFIGSGKRGRTFLFEQQGYWFESPINWYGKQGVWDMAPNYQATKTLPLTLPVDPGCLSCHTSGAADALPDARNHYAAAPFAAGGITCVACHGDGSKHVASGGKAGLIDIDALEPVRRDSTCLACHLEGQAAVSREGKRRNDFRPGDNLFEFMSFFVRAGEGGSGGRATSQWEALLKSECKRRSGDRLTCTSCHDPHGSPAASERVAFYRAKCLACHNEQRFAEQHHPENPDCTACHMARPPSNDIAHEQVTDHWIRKRVSQERVPLATTGELVPVGGSSANDRELGMAYAQFAVQGDQAAAQKAVELLRRAEAKDSGAATDHELHEQLGLLDQLAGKSSEAEQEYRKALDADAYDAVAEGNLGYIAAKQRHYSEAERLWGDVFRHDPVQVEAGMNLAILECAAGQRSASAATLGRVLTFAPDDARARAMREAIDSGRQRCGAAK